MKKYLILTALIVIGLLAWQRQTLTRLVVGIRQHYKSKDRAKYYLVEKDTIQDISELLSDDESIPLSLRQPLLNKKRRIVVFKYPSGDQMVAGYLSYIPGSQKPLIVFLRGGNGYMGIMRPNNPFSFFEGFNVVGTLYRGIIYGGEDELGGADVEDVENLIRFLPQLENFTKTKLSPPFTLMGVSRGAMQVFATLAHSKFVSDRTDKTISISGNLDLNVSKELRPEMNYLFNSKFNSQTTHKTFSEWLTHRDPVSLASKLKKSIKVLLIYGSKDERVHISEQENFKRALEESGIKVELLKIPGADHSMGSHMEEVNEAVLQFLKPATDS